MSDGLTEALRSSRDNEGPSINDIKDNIIEGINTAMEGINGPSISRKDIIVSEGKVLISFDLHVVEDDDYIGICPY